MHLLTERKPNTCAYQEIFSLLYMVCVVCANKRGADSSVIGKWCAKHPRPRIRWLSFGVNEVWRVGSDGDNKEALEQGRGLLCCGPHHGRVTTLSSDCRSPVQSLQTHYRQAIWWQFSYSNYKLSESEYLPFLWRLCLAGAASKATLVQSTEKKVRGAEAEVTWLLGSVLDIEQTSLMQGNSLPDSCDKPLQFMNFWRWTFPRSANWIRQGAFYPYSVVHLLTWEQENDILWLSQHFISLPKKKDGHGEGGIVTYWIVAPVSVPDYRCRLSLDQFYNHDEKDHFMPLSTVFANKIDCCIIITGIWIAQPIRQWDLALDAYNFSCWIW